VEVGLAGEPARTSSDGTLNKAIIGEMQGTLKAPDTWRPTTTVCGLPVQGCMLLLLGVAVLLCTTLAIVLPQTSTSKQQIIARVWQQRVSDAGFELEVKLFVLLL
jgi:hypothetical protein